MSTSGPRKDLEEGGTSGRDTATATALAQHDSTMTMTTTTASINVDVDANEDDNSARRLGGHDSRSSDDEQHANVNTNRSSPTTSYPPCRSWKEYLLRDVDTTKATLPLAWFCFMTGFLDAISFSASFVWCGFQTGNTLQLSLSLARLFAPGNKDFSFRPVDRLALISLVAFLVGASFGRVGDRLRVSNARIYLSLGTLMQSILTAAAAITAWRSGQPSVASDRGDPAWTNALSSTAIGFMSASVGIQGIMGKRIKSEFATTVVLTTVWCELAAERHLFSMRYVSTRDHRILAIVALFIGGFAGRSILDKTDAAVALGIASGIRCLIALGWLFVPEKREIKE